jgi:hypothetical protein
MPGVIVVVGVLVPFVILPRSAAAAVTARSHEAMEAVRWGFVIGVGAEALLLAIAVLMGVGVGKLVIGQDGRVSTSKTIAAVWTLVVAAILFALVYASLLDHSQALDATNASGVVGKYALLFGGPLGAAILAKGIVTRQVTQNPSAKTPAKSTSLTDLVANDGGDVDLGDFQYVLFNLVAFVFVIATLLHDPLKGLPDIPAVLLGLTSVSAVGYVGKKALPPTGIATATLTPATGPPGTPVTIAVSGLTPAKQADALLWVRFDNTEPGEILSGDITGGRVTLQRLSPSLQPTPKAPVAVSVATADGTVVNAGSYAYA